MKKGLDVSSHNGNVDWQAVKNAGFGDFAIIRLGIGNDDTTQDDAKFDRNVQECERLGIPYGVYIYSYALNTNDARSEANHTLRQLRKVGSNFKYGVWFDMEDADNYKRNHGMPSNSTLVDICYTFCQIIEAAGYYTGVYASLSWLNNQLNSSKLDRFDKWVAQWSSRCTYQKPYSIWQYTSDEYIGGNRFDANYLIRDFAGGGGTPTPAPTPSPSGYTGDITYKVYDNQKGMYLPSVVNDRDYAGNRGNTIGGIKAKCQNGNIYMETHIIGKAKTDWEETVTLNASNYDSSSPNAYSGILGRNIDCVKIWSDRGHVLYRVSPVNENYYSWVDSRNRNNGTSESYAGSYGKPIDRLQMK